MITNLAQFGRLTTTFTRLLLRDHQIVFWNFGFFLILLLLFLGFLSGGESAVRIALTVSIVTIAVMANTLFSVGIGLAAARERGVSRRYRLTPVSPGRVVAASVAARLIIVLSAAVVQVLAAHFLFDVSWRGGVASWLMVLTLGTVTFGGIALLIAAVAPAVHIANRMVNIVLIPMMALSGASLPVEMLPAAWGEVRWILPAAPIVDGLTGAFVHGDGVVDNVWRASALSLWAIAAYAIGAYQWRKRES